MRWLFYVILHLLVSLRAVFILKVLKIIQLGPLPPPVGGMATVVEDLAAEQAKQHQVRVLDVRKTTSENRPLWQRIWVQLVLVMRLFHWRLF